MKYTLTSSTFRIQEKEAMLRVIDSDMFTMGKNVKEFEEEFANYFGKKYAIMVSYGRRPYINR